MRRLLPLLLLAVLASGCRTTAMKGTPFYTGESARREGGVETPFAESEFETEDYAPRLVDVSPVNVRDLGGRIGLGGRRGAPT